MKTIVYFFLSAALLTLNGCGTDNRESSASESEGQEANTAKDTPVKLIEYLVGEWEMASGQGSTDNQNHPGERLTFTSEARYIAYRGNQKVDSGAYRMNEQLENLYLESEANETPREFNLKLEANELTLLPDGAADDSGASYVYRRIGQASIPPDKSAEGDETEQTEKQ